MIYRENGYENTINTYFLRFYIYYLYNTLFIAYMQEKLQICTKNLQKCIDMRKNALYDNLRKRKKKGDEKYV